MVDKVNNLISSYLGSGDYRKVSEELLICIKVNPNISRIYLTDELQRLLLVDKDYLYDFTSCLKIVDDILKIDA